MPAFCLFALLVASAPLSTDGCETPSQLESDLAAASQADVLDLWGVNPLLCPGMAMSECWTGGKLILSDAPESPNTRGKLYEDTTLEATALHNRIFLYHANGSSGRLKFTVLLSNLGSCPGALRISRKGTAGPTADYLYGGKIAFYRWLNSTSGDELEVPPGATVQLDSTFDSTQAPPRSLMHGIWDYSFSQPHRVSICALEVNDDPSTVCPGLDVLPRDVHSRGTFPYAEKQYGSAPDLVVDTGDGIQQVPIASGEDTDAYAIGSDATDGSEVTNRGNYGILYRVVFSTAASDGRNLAFLLNPRGGAWGGALKATPGITPGGVFLIPGSATSMQDNSRGALVGEYSPGESLRTSFYFMPTGGSSFPLRVIGIPYSKP